MENTPTTNTNILLDNYGFNSYNDNMYPNTSKLEYNKSFNMNNNINISLNESNSSFYINYLNSLAYNVDLSSSLEVKAIDFMDNIQNYPEILEIVKK